MQIVEIGMVLVAGGALAFVAYQQGHKEGKTKEEAVWVRKLPDIKQEAIRRSRSVIGGQFSEQLAPYLPGFKHKPTEAVFVGKPVDFIVFTGSDEKNVQEVVFVEVKSGEARISPVESKLKTAIEQKRVRWEEYRVPKPLTEPRPDNAPVGPAPQI